VPRSARLSGKHSKREAAMILQQAGGVKRESLGERDLHWITRKMPDSRKKVRESGRVSLTFATLWLGFIFFGEFHGGEFICSLCNVDMWDWEAGCRHWPGDVVDRARESVVGSEKRPET